MSDKPSFLEKPQVVREYKRYFEEQPNKTPESWRKFRKISDLKLNTEGFTTYGTAPLDKDAIDHETFECPEGLMYERVTPIANEEAYFVWDPEIADVQRVVIGPKRNSPISLSEEQDTLQANGWKYVDGNWSRIIYAKRKLGLTPVSVPDDISNDPNLKAFVPRNTKITP